MKNYCISLFCMSLLSVNTSYSADNKAFEKGAFVRLIKGPAHLKTTVLQIKGTTKDIWGIDDVYGSKESFSYPVITNYLKSKDAIDDGGTVYYVENVYGFIKYCVHESWIVSEDNFTQEDKPVTSKYKQTKDGKWVRKYYTNRDLEKKREKQRAKDSKIPALERFKRDYIDDYYPDAIEKKDLFVRYAPPKLRQWFKDIQENKNPQPILMQDAIGEGKTMTSQALVSSINATLCHVYMPALMRWDWKDNRFEAKHLDALGGTICVMVDNIQRLADDDVENLHLLVDFCNARDNIHLLAIAYSARKHMPQELYKKFRHIDFLTISIRMSLALAEEKNQEAHADGTEDRSLARSDFEQAKNPLTLNRRARQSEEPLKQKSEKQQISIEPSSNFNKYAVIGTCAAVGIGGIAALTYLNIKNKKS